MVHVLFIVITILVFINVMLAVVLVFFGRRTPASTWVWLMALVLLPVVGFIIYLVFGQDIKKSSIFNKKGRDDNEIRIKFINEVNNGIYRKIHDYQTKVYKAKELSPDADFYSISLNDLVYHNIKVDCGLLTGNNSIAVFNNGKEKFDSLLSDIKGAKQYIHILYYIIKNDDMGNKLIDALSEKAREGVEVLLLYDGMGCMRTGKQLFKRLNIAGGTTANFLPPLLPSINVRLNYRNHRKIAVIDGKTGYIGGINIGDEYLGKSQKFGFWRDMHIRLEGGAVNYLELRFVMDWNFASGKKIELKDMYFPMQEDKFKGERVQIISSGPDTVHSNIKNIYFKMINEAENSIFFTTPYFVPDDSILAALKVAALSGIDVRIIFPGKPDHPFVYWASLSYISELLEAGVKCFQYEKGFIHSKMIVVDEVVSAVGTANMDIRSFALNFETTAVIYSKIIGDIINKQFLLDQSDSFEITEKWYANTPKIYRLREAFARLISPIL